MRGKPLMRPHVRWPHAHARTHVRPRRLQTMLSNCMHLRSRCDESLMHDEEDLRACTILFVDSHPADAALTQAFQKATPVRLGGYTHTEQNSGPLFCKRARVTRRAG